MEEEVSAPAEVGGPHPSPGTGELADGREEMVFVVGSRCDFGLAPRLLEPVELLELRSFHRLKNGFVLERCFDLEPEFPGS